ncbi:DNA fragmentation factor subunit beta isoform X2 [Anabrus simplex]|uniref:DNA fragmentation factor subunit beta isoform X2 n=1 Tax=Anabrus simplex TaxID=316456 RepID=UPI0035A3A51B
MSDTDLVSCSWEEGQTRGAKWLWTRKSPTSTGYKITDAKRTRKIGVGCNSLKELKSKGCSKFNFDHRLEDKLIVQLEDGTIVDEEPYFDTLPSNTLFILLLPGENSITGAEIIYNALKAVNLEYLRAGDEARKFFSENMKKKFLELSVLLTDSSEDKFSNNKGLKTKRYFSNRSDDPEWFKEDWQNYRPINPVQSNFLELPYTNLDTNANTKEKFLFRRSQDRIRGYFYKSNADLRNSLLYKENSKVREKIDDVIGHIAKHLTGHEYFGSYFNRKAEPCTARLCNEDGDFMCKGPWQASCCNYLSHTINPYDSREARIIFSTWNLDHRIERSRTILPAILDAASLAVRTQCPINWEYFFDLLFTTKNLKLVHIVCHDKGKHSVECDPEQYIKFLQSTKNAV